MKWVEVSWHYLLRNNLFPFQDDLYENADVGGNGITAVALYDYQVRYPHHFLKWAVWSVNPVRVGSSLSLKARLHKRFE